MKKLSTLLLAVVLVLSMGASAFAAEDNDSGTMLNGGNDALNFRVGDSTDSDTGDYDFDTFDAVDISPRFEWVDNENIMIEAGDLFLVDTTTKLYVLPETPLIPGHEYEFQVFVATADVQINIDNTIDVGTHPNIAPLTEGDINANGNTNGRLRLSNGKGTGSISKADLKLKGQGSSRYYLLALETKDDYGTKMTEVSYALTPSGTLPIETMVPGLSVLKSNVSFKVGHQKMTDSEIDDYSEGDVVTIYNERPVMTKKQIERLVKAYNYKAIELEFEDGSWRYEGRMSGMGDTNFYTTHEVIPSIMNKFDQDFKFLILPGGASFPTNGEMRIDVSDVSGDWDRVYTYLYRNGKLTPINTSYDGTDDMIYFRTNYLGAFVMTDVEITDTSILDDNNSDNSSSSPDSSGDSGTGTGTGNNNPPTGIPAGMNLIAGLGVVSLLGAGTVIIRKKK